MPYVDNNGVKIWWQEEGEGEPILAIMGLSFPLQMWHRTTPSLSRRYRVILLDNRGVGRSDVPRGRYPIASMADDAAAVLTAAGVERAHVVGASMGGMIAQELALRHPHRVRSLVLGCTWCGGWRAARPNLRLFPSLRQYQSLPPEGKMRSLIPMLYTPDTPLERIDEDIAVRMANFPVVHGYYGQLLGIATWSSWKRLPQIQQPVKILHGELDRLIPVENAHILAKRIPHASVSILPSAGHVFITDQPDLANREALRFLKEVEEREASELELAQEKMG